MENIQCPACKAFMPKNASLCHNCQYPFVGTEKEKAIHIGRFINQKGVIQDSEDSVSKSRNILYLIVVLNAIFLFVSVERGELELLDIIFNATITIIILSCALFFKYNPFVFSLVPLGLMLLVYLLNFIVDPMSLLQGILLKIFVVGTLSYNIYLSVKARNFKDKYGIKSPPN